MGRKVEIATRWMLRPSIFLGLMFLVSSGCCTLFSQEGELAMTPSVGWNSWKSVHREVSEDTIRQNAGGDGRFRYGGCRVSVHRDP